MILMLSTDSTICKKGSDTERRMVEYGTLFDELHIVVYTREHFEKKRISQNVYVYPTNTKHKLFYYWGAYGICKKILKRGRYFVVTSQDAMNNFLVFFLRIRFSFVFQVQIHTDFLSPYFKKTSLKNTVHYWGYMVGLHYADCIRVVSKRISDSLKAKNYKLKTNPTVLPIRVDIKTTKDTTTILQTKYPQFNFFVLWVGRLEKEKNAELAIFAMKKIVEKNPMTALVIIGEGSERARLEQKRNNLGLIENVIFEGLRDDVLVYYKSADMLLVTSLYEGYGRQIVEARTLGLPVVSTPVGVAEESGARIVPWRKNEIAQSILEVQNNTHTSTLYKYPYEDKQKYLELYKNTFTQCLQVHIKK